MHGPDLVISIHAPRVGGDLWEHQKDRIKKDISIHAPRVGGDTKYFDSFKAPELFQSTPPVWGATISLADVRPHVMISIHAPRVGGDKQLADSGIKTAISIHAPRVGGDQC